MSCNKRAVSCEREGIGLGTNRVEMHQVRYFLAVARHLNFTRAADEVRVAQPSLTRAIQKLEVELEGPLFRRERSNTHLTELGRMILPHLMAAHAAAENARSQARSLKTQGAGSLLLGIGIGIETARPTHLVVQAARKLVSLDLSVEVAATAVIERRLAGGELDAAVLVPSASVHERFDLHLIQEDDLVVVFAEGHRFERQSAVPLDALDGEPLIVRSDCAIEDDLARVMEARGLARRVRHSSNDLRWTSEFVRQGFGSAVLPRSAALAQAMLFRPLDDTTLRCRVMLALVPGRRHSRALTTLIELVKASARPGLPQ